MNKSYTEKEKSEANRAEIDQMINILLSGFDDEPKQDETDQMIAILLSGLDKPQAHP